MNTFKAFKYLADTRGELHIAVQILAEMDYQVPPLPQVNPGRYNVIRATGSGDVEFLPQDVFDLIALPSLSLKELREMVGEQKDVRIAELEAQLKQAQRNTTRLSERHAEITAYSVRVQEYCLELKNNLEHERQLNYKLRSVKEALKSDIGHERRRLVSKQEQLDACRRHLQSMTNNRDDLVKKLTEVGEHVSELNEKLRFRDQVIDSQKRTIQEWTQAYARVSKELEAAQNENSELRGRLQSSHDASAARNVLTSHQEAQLDAAAKKLVKLQAENEDLRKWGQEAKQVHARAIQRLGDLETKIIESKKQQNAVLELKDRRIADLERELNTCKANYNRLLWMED